MEWKVSEQGFQMSLAREIPELIQHSIDGFLDRLCSQAKLSRAICALPFLPFIRRPSHH